jgi:hypothetical protein
VARQDPGDRYSSCRNPPAGGGQLEWESAQIPNFAKPTVSVRTPLRRSLNVSRSARCDRRFPAPSRPTIAPRRYRRQRDPRLPKILTGEIEEDIGDSGKDNAAQALGRKGGAARRDKFTPEPQAEIARKAAAKRWST